MNQDEQIATTDEATWPTPERLIPSHLTGAPEWLSPAGIPPELQNRRAWMFWNASGAEGPQRKKPLAYRHRRRSFEADNWQDPSNWMPYEDAVEIALANNMGLGTVLNGDGLTVIDIDSGEAKGKQPALPPGSLAEQVSQASWARQMIEAATYMESFSEYSSSRKGIHIWGYSNITSNRNVRPCELYITDRFMIVTGLRIATCPAEVRSFDERKLEVIMHRYFPPKDTGDGQLSEEELKILRSLGTGGEVATRDEIIKALQGDRFSEALEVALKPGAWKVSARGFDSQSEADWWLMHELAWATRGDISRMDQLFRGSVLMRAKYDDRRGKETIGSWLLEGAMERYINKQKEYALKRQNEQREIV